MFSFDAPKAKRSGLANRMPKIVQRMDVTLIRKNAAFIIFSAPFLFPRPRSIEQSGAPPIPYSDVNARISVITGKAIPTPPSACVPYPGILPM